MGWINLHWSQDGADCLFADHMTGLRHFWRKKWWDRDFFRRTNWQRGDVFGLKITLPGDISINFSSFSTLSQYSWSFPRLNIIKFSYSSYLYRQKGRKDTQFQNKWRALHTLVEAEISAHLPRDWNKKDSINYLSSACWRGRFAIGKTSQGWGNWSSTSWVEKWVTLALGCFWFGSKTSHNKKLRKIVPQLVPTEFSPDGETEKDVFFDGETHPNKHPTNVGQDVLLVSPSLKSEGNSL